MRSRWSGVLAVVVAVALVVGLVGPALAAAAPVGAGEAMVALVYYREGLDAAALAAVAGVELEEDYGSFALCTLTPAARGALEARAATLSRIERGRIRLRGMEFNTGGGEPAFDPALRIFYGNGPGHYLVQFIGPIKAAWRERLAKMGEIVAYIPDYTYLVKLDRAARATVAKWHEVYWIGVYHAAYRLAPGITDVLSGDFCIEFFPGTAGASGLPALRSLGLEIVNSQPVRAVVRGAASLLQACALLDEVMWIEPYVAPRLYNKDARAAIKADACHGRGILAADQVVAITDTGVWTAHEAFSEAGKVAAFVDISGDAPASGGDGDGHGTHVACSALGDAPAYRSYTGYDGQGLAARAVVVKVFNNDGRWAAGGDCYSLWDRAYHLGARVNNNSWGTDSGGAYVASSRAADSVTWDHRDYVLAVAAGNAGDDGANTIDAPGTSKNAITVGASVTAGPGGVAEFSSRGPTDDGRIKPDVMAPGTFIRSAERGVATGYVSMQGTSMATPQCAGASALVRDYFMRGFYPSGAASPADALAPSAALVKAVLVNGCREMTGARSDRNGESVWPNNAQGWGRLDLDRSLYFAGDARALTVWDSPDALSTGQTWTGTVDLADGTRDLKVTLCWTDYPAAPGASVTLVNDLNLKVIAPDGTAFCGNCFAGANAGYSRPGGAPDARNTVEGVHLQPGYSYGGGLPPGTYTISVTAANMAQPASNFAVVVTSGASDAPPPSEQVAVMGDYNGQIASLLKGRGYTVRGYGPAAYAQVIANLGVHEVVVLHDIENTGGLDDLLAACRSFGRGVVFCSSYPVWGFGMGVLSARKGDPHKADDQQWSKVPVQLTVVQEHPIFTGYSAGQTVTIINGGDNGYQTYDAYTGQNLAESAMPDGLRWMVGCKDESQLGGGRHALMGSFGCWYWTDVSKWTDDGKRIFCNAVEWCRGGFPPPPPAPVLVSPARGEGGIRTNPTLLWTTVTGATSYRVQVATDGDFINLVFDRAGLDVTLAVVTPCLRDGTRCWWRVNARNAGGVSAWTTGTFTTTLAPPPPPVLTAPAAGAGGVATTPDLAWAHAPGATSYRVQVALDSGFSNICFDQASVWRPAVKVSPALPDGAPCWWRACAANAGGTSDWSVGRFVTAIAAPGLRAPAAAAGGVGAAPSLQWGAVPGAASYRVQVASDIAFSTVVFDRAGVNDTAVIVSPPLARAQRYWWRVNAQSGYGVTSPWSFARSLTVVAAAPPVPALLSPVAGAAGVSTRPYLAWAVSSGATSCAVEVARDPAFSQVVYSRSGVTAATVRVAPGLSRGVQYWWRVRAVNAGGTSPWSEAWDFTTMALPWE